jgi:hypothetical protein
MTMMSRPTIRSVQIGKTVINPMFVIALSPARTIAAHRDHSAAEKRPAAARSWKHPKMRRIQPHAVRSQTMSRPPVDVRTSSLKIPTRP